MLPEYWSDVFFYTVAIAVLGGFFRGFSGFGAIMAMTPLFILLIDAPKAAAISFIIDSIATLPLMRGARKDTQWRSVGIMFIAAVITLPLGIWALASFDRDIMRPFIAIALLVAALLLISPWRYRGKQTPTGDVVSGGLSGLLGGATSMAGPPVILYLVGQKASAATIRATFLFYSFPMSIVAIGMMWGSGVIDSSVVLYALALVPCNLLAVGLGARAFSLVNDEGFRRFTLWFLVIIAVSVFFLG